MKVRHKNSEAEFDLSKPCYYKHYSIYGYLVMGGKDIFFIPLGLDDLSGYECISDEFEEIYFSVFIAEIYNN